MHLLFEITVPLQHLFFLKVLNMLFVLYRKHIHFFYCTPYIFLFFFSNMKYINVTGFLRSESAKGSDRGINRSVKSHLREFID